MPYSHDKGAHRVTQVTRGFGAAVSGVTGIVAAALAIDSILFAVRADPANKVRIFLQQLRMQWTTLTAFTTPITVGRRLGVYRGSGAALTGGAALVVANIDTNNLGPAGAGAGISDARIATTVALTPGGFVREANPAAVMTLTEVGAAGGYKEIAEEYSAPKSPLVLNPGELCVISNPILMDAGGTFQLGVTLRFANADQLL